MVRSAKKESEVLKQIRGQLPLFCRDCIHIDRLNSGSIHSGNLHMTLCQPGTPDLYAVLKTNGGHVLFIECKRPGGRQSDAQRSFQARVSGLTRIHYLVAVSVNDVLDYIKKNIFDNSVGVDYHN